MRILGQALAIAGVLLFFQPGWVPFDPLVGRVVAAALLALGLTVAVLGAVLSNLPEDARMDPLPDEEIPDACLPLVERIEALGFARLGPAQRVHLEPMASIVPLWHAAHQAYATVFVSDGASATAHYDFVTVFDGKVGLTSAANPAAGVLPLAPGTFLQVFKGEQPEELLPRHLEGAGQLAQAASLRLSPRCDRFEDLLADALRRQRHAFLKAPLRHTWTALWRVVSKRTPALGPVLDQRATRDRIDALSNPLARADEPVGAR
jgi:hypothetical protein